MKEKPKNYGTVFAWPVLSHLIGMLSQRESATANLKFSPGTFKMDLQRLFVTVTDHTTDPEHQLLFFKERFSAKRRKLGLREETIG